MKSSTVLSRPWWWCRAKQMWICLRLWLWRWRRSRQSAVHGRGKDITLITWYTQKLLVTILPRISPASGSRFWCLYCSLAQPTAMKFYLRIVLLGVLWKDYIWGIWYFISLWKKQNPEIWSSASLFACLNEKGLSTADRTNT